MTDFVGWVPMPDGGDREAFLTADYNAEMVEHVARYPRLRDRSVFVGDPDDVVDLPLGPGPADRSATGPRSTSTSPATSWASGPTRRTAASCAHAARLRRRRGGLRGQRRRLRASAHHLLRRVVDAYDAGRGADARAADGRGRPVRGIDPAALGGARRAWRCTASCPTSTCTTPRATSRSSRAG